VRSSITTFVKLGALHKSVFSMEANLGDKTSELSPLLVNSSKELITSFCHEGPSQSVVSLQARVNKGPT